MRWIRPFFPGVLGVVPLLALAVAPEAQVGTVASEQKVSEISGGFGGELDPGDQLGRSVAAVGDLDGDGVGDLAVGSHRDDDGGTDQGAVWILFLSADGTVASEQKISETAGGFGGVLDAGDFFGNAVAALGDLDGDGKPELAVGALLDDDGGSNQGAVWILSLNADGTVSSERKISATAGGFAGVLHAGDNLGTSVAALGDLDGDGIVDLATGACGDDDGGADQGAAWILFLNADGTVASEQKISETAGGFGGVLDPTDFFATSVCAPGDVDGDGLPDLVSGAYLDDDGGTDQGAIWLLFLNADGTVASHTKISETTGGFGGVLEAGDRFGYSVAGLGDLDHDGALDLALGAPLDDGGGTNQGALWILFLAADGTVASHQEIGESAGGFAGVLAPEDRFGISVAALGDHDGDGVPDLAVGALFDDDGGTDQGALWILHLEADTIAPLVTCPGTQVAEGAGPDGAAVSFTPSASDDHDPTPTLECVPPSGSTFPLGTTTVTCTATDDSGNSGACSFDVTVADTTAPAVTCPSGIAVETTNPEGEVVTFAPTAADLCDPSPVIDAVPASGSTFALGSTTVVVTATDAHGNAATCSFDVLVQEPDTLPPLVTCPGSQVAEGTGPDGAAVSFEATATDGRDPTPTVVCVPPSGSTFPLGTTTVTCTATDDAGNSDSCSFDVVVVDTTAPVVTCPADVVVETTNPEGEVVSFSPSATDACDPSPSIGAEPASGSTFALGTTTVTVTAADDQGNFSTCTFHVVVQEPDTTPPLLVCPGDQVAECTGPEGAAVSFEVTATDERDPAPDVVCVPASGSTFPLGTTTVTCTATDDAGNSDTCSFDVTVEDTTPPALTCPAVVVALEAKGSPAGEPAFFSVTASDAGDPAPSVVCVPPSGSVFPRGTTLVTCTATDASGNTTSRAFPVVVGLPVLPRRL